MRTLTACLLALSTACGASVEPGASTSAPIAALGCVPESGDADIPSANVSAIESEIAAPADAAPWCAPLEPVQVACAIDPLVACEERNGRQSASAHACGTYASTSCVGFDSTCAGVIVYCCD